MVAGFVVACFGDRAECDDGQVLRESEGFSARKQVLRALGNDLFQIVVLVCELFVCFAQTQVRLNACQQDGRHDWLGDVIDGAQRQAVRNVTDFLMR